MREWIKRWLGTPTLYDPAAMFEKLQQAQSEHISDLRVLIDKGNDREAVLASILREAVTQPKSQRVNAAERTENKSEPIIPLESLSDVSSFDEGEDAADLKRHDDKGRALEAEFRQLFEEQTVEGVHKP